MISTFLQKLDGVKPCSDGYTALCPAHDDKQPSLSISTGDDGRLLLYCHAGCTPEAIVEALNMTMTELYPAVPAAPKPRNKMVKVYPYTDADGILILEVCRFEPKKFLQRRPDPDKPGKYLWNVKGITKPLYLLPQVLKAIEANKWVFVVEGEKDADNLCALGVTATTNAGGAKKWNRKYSELLNQAQGVIILPHKDPLDKTGNRAGMRHAHLVLSQLTTKAAIVELPNRPEKGGDVTDWIKAGGTIPELKTLMDQALKTREEAPPPPINAPDATDESLNLTELSAAHRLRAMHGDVLRHSTGMGWHVWDEKRWQPSEKAVWRFAQKIGGVIRDELHALGPVETPVASRFTKFANLAESARGIEAILKQARTLDGIDGDTIEWDSHPWLLNCPNGVVDLSTGELSEHDKALYVTKMCPTPYDGQARCLRWLQFLKEVTCDDSELADYLQWVFGYSLTGSVDSQCFFVCHGPAASGKSTAMTVFQKVLGPEYAQQINPEELMLQHNARHTTELAALRGARFVVAVETNEGRRLNESLLKGLTGGDRMRARLMRQDSFEFAPELKLFISTNHRPVVRDSSEGLWRRLRLLPFEAEFTGENRDTNILEKLLSEREGILAWAVAGARRAAEGEPEIPKRVRAAVEEYQTEQDALAQFIESECETHRDLRVGKTIFHKTLRDWTKGPCCTQRELAPRMKRLGFEEGFIHHGKAAWLGIGLAVKNLEINGEVR